MSDTYHPLAAGVAHIPRRAGVARLALVGGGLALLRIVGRDGDGERSQRDDGNGDSLHFDEWCAGKCMLFG